MPQPLPGTMARYSVSLFHKMEFFGAAEDDDDESTPKLEESQASFHAKVLASYTGDTPALTSVSRLGNLLEGMLENRLQFCSSLVKVQPKVRPPKPTGDFSQRF